MVTWDVVSSDQAWLDLQTWHLATSEFQNQQRYATQMARVQERLDVSLPPFPTTLNRPPTRPPPNNNNPQTDPENTKYYMALPSLP